LCAHRFRKRACGRFFVIELSDVVNLGHGAHEYFARGKRTDDANADFPIESERSDRRFKHASQFPGIALAQLRARIAAAFRVGRQEPK